VNDPQYALLKLQAERASLAEAPHVPKDWRKRYLREHRRVKAEVEAGTRQHPKPTPIHLIGAGPIYW